MYIRIEEHSRVIRDYQETISALRERIMSLEMDAVEDGYKHKAQVEALEQKMEQKINRLGAPRPNVFKVVWLEGEQTIKAKSMNVSEEGVVLFRDEAGEVVGLCPKDTIVIREG
jgi:hypothetical protein